MGGERLRKSYWEADGLNEDSKLCDIRKTNEQHAVIPLLLWSGLNYISGNWGQIGCLGLLENLTNLKLTIVMQILI